MNASPAPKAAPTMVPHGEKIERISGIVWRTLGKPRHPGGRRRA
jgi:hypothetical protein